MRLVNLVFNNFEAQGMEIFIPENWKHGIEDNYYYRLALLELNVDHKDFFLFFR
jgi:hypothetical protein